MNKYFILFLKVIACVILLALINASFNIGGVLGGVMFVCCFALFLFIIAGVAAGVNRYEFTPKDQKIWNDVAESGVIQDCKIDDLKGCDCKCNELGKPGDVLLGSTHNHSLYKCGVCSGTYLM